MHAHIHQALSDSAQDFQDAVWPQVSALPLVNGGVIRPVEAVAERNFKDELDLLAGIDAWQILDGPSAIRGIASRVQWGVSRASFTIRTKVASGRETEFHKRLRAIQNIEEGHLFPHLTVQAYLDQRKGRLLAAAAVRTKDLVEIASVLVERRAHLHPRPDLYGFITNEDGTEFLYMKWVYLTHKNALDASNIIKIAE